MPDEVAATEEEHTGRQTTLGDHEDGGEVRHVFDDSKKSPYRRTPGPGTGVVILQKKLRTPRLELLQMHNITRSVYGWYQVDNLGVFRRGLA